MCAPITLDDVDHFPPRIQDEVRRMLVFTIRLQMILQCILLFAFFLLMVYSWLTQ